MIRPALLLAVSVALAIWLAATLLVPRGENRQAGPAVTSEADLRSPLVVFCAASNREVMQTIVRDYEQEFGVPIDFQFGPSQALLTSIEVSHEGDLYLPADDSYVEIAASRGLIVEIVPLARMHVVLGVKTGNPRLVRTYDDLLRSDVRVVQANPEVAAVGKLTRDALTPLEKWEPLNRKTATFVSTVTEAANSVQAGAADVAIVYDAILTSSNELEAVEIDEFKETFADIKIGLIKHDDRRRTETSLDGRHRRAAHFARYLSASDRGLKRYREFGFMPVQGSPWDGAPLP